MQQSVDVRDGTDYVTAKCEACADFGVKGQLIGFGSGGTEVRARAEEHAAATGHYVRLEATVTTLYNPTWRPF